MKIPRRVVIEQILFALIKLNDYGIYYGPKKYFNKRQTEAFHWINELLRDNPSSP